MPSDREIDDEPNNAMAHTAEHDRSQRDQGLVASARSAAGAGDIGAAEGMVTEALGSTDAVVAGEAAGALGEIEIARLRKRRRPN